MKFNFFKKKTNDTAKEEIKAESSNETEKEPLSIKKIVIDKLDRSINTNLNGISIFERVNDARSIFLTERNIHKNIIYIAFFFFLTTIVCLILIISLFPLKEKEPYLVAFSEASQNFVTIERADSTITSNEALVRSLIGSYIINRETINHIDDKKRYDVVKNQSSPRVWKNFESIIAQEKSIYTNANLIRDIEIINIAKWKDGYSNVDVVIKLYNSQGMYLESEKRYRIIIVYKFQKQKITFDNISINPTGFQVLDYSITQLAVIKELDSNKKVGKDSINSKIKEDKQSSNIDDYIQNDINLNMPSSNQTNPAKEPTKENSTYLNIDDYMRNNPNIFPQNQNNNTPTPFQ